jgi:hypothetical protein
VIDNSNSEASQNMLVAVIAPIVLVALVPLVYVVLVQMDTPEVEEELTFAHRCNR